MYINIIKHGLAVMCHIYVNMYVMVHFLYDFIALTSNICLNNKFEDSQYVGNAFKPQNIEYIRRHYYFQTARTICGHSVQN